MKETVLDLKNRRSIRKFTNECISENELDTILEAGLYAASGMNRQSPVMVAISNKALVEELSMLNASIMGTKGDPFYGASCVVIVFADTNVHTYVEDGSLVMGNMMNAAQAIGLGSCWIHRAREMFETPRGKELKALWGIEDNYVGIGNLILGYPLETPQPKPRREGRVIRIK